MSTDYIALIRAVADTLDECSPDGLTVAQAALASHALRTVAGGLEDDSLDELLAILQSLADAMGEGRISPPLAFLLGIATRDALRQLENLPHRQVVPFGRRR